MKLMLDEFQFNQKPQGYEIGLINNRIIKHPVDIDVSQLANEIINGKTFTPATFKYVAGELKRSKANWASQEIVALDFDEGLTIEEALKDTFFQEHASFLYTTFSHTEAVNKFRVVFALDRPVNEYTQFESIISFLLNKYPYADQSCKDGSRLFFGGNQLYDFNYDNRLNVDDIILETPLQDIKDNLINMSCNRVQHSPKLEIGSVTATARNINLIKNREISKLQLVINNKPVTLVPNEVLSYLKKQDLRLLLGVDTKSNFLDIFHEESNPSASIYKSQLGNGHWLYKCHSESYPFAGTILHVVERLLNCNIIEARDFLIKVYKIKVFESEEMKRFKESIDLYKELLQSDELEEIHPYFYKVFSRYGHLRDLNQLLDLTKSYVFNYKEPKIVFYHGIRTLAKYFNRSTSATGTRINFLTLFHLMRKLDEEEVPEDMLKLQKKIKRDNNYQYRNTTYELPLYSYELFNKIDQKCKLWLEKGCTSRTISYEGILRTFGIEEAERVYPQDRGKEISQINEEIVSQIHYTALMLIEYKGWTTEKEILSNLNLKFRGQQEFKTTQYKRCIGELIDAYDLEITPSNKIIKEKLNITEEHMSRFSFPKIIIKKDLVMDCNPLQGNNN
ncbi:hypothetical protein ACFPRB_18175 [Metabacillus niabensis]|uniref:Primase C-terminal 1 domain-containing protein n=1 Tax=Metabacillus niabensis TaxID=324854 RepID=A0ABT9Z8M4_9BACI|nr:hypothetical protein [Metabacillus niabensis]MDQ0228599.1 hypothetical protein [Metabacillus niabensis]